jgi:HTH-type transcriptional regulator/antitoxin HipB
MTQLDPVQVGTVEISAARDLAALVRGRRIDAGWSQTVLADRAGVSRQWLSALERGKASVEVGLVLRVLDVLGVDLAARDRDGGPAPDRHPVDLDRLLDEHRAEVDEEPHPGAGPVA